MRSAEQPSVPGEGTAGVASSRRGPAEGEQPAALLAEFPTAEAMVEAAGGLRRAGYRKWDAHSPFPVHGLERAMGIRPTRLPWLVLLAGVAGAAAAIGLQWWTNAVDYPMRISGKPLFSLPANIPVAFELVILFSALAAFFGVLALNRMPQFGHAVFASPRFRRASSDGFFLSVEADDPQFDALRTRQLLESLGATAVEACPQPAGGGTVPGAVYWIVATSIVLALMPPLAVAWYRAVPKSSPRIHPISDMDFQPKYKAQSASGLFADGRAMRPALPHTVARGRWPADEALYRGTREGQPVGRFPLPVTMELMRRGRQRYEIYCAACHGLAGDGDGMVSLRALQREEPNWVPPVALHEERIRRQPVGQLFRTITHGVRTMPAYGPQIPVEDRWAIVLYVRALQRSQHARLEDVPEERREQLR